MMMRKKKTKHRITNCSLNIFITVTALRSLLVEVTPTPHYFTMFWLSVFEKSEGGLRIQPTYDRLDGLTAHWWFLC